MLRRIFLVPAETPQENIDILESVFLKTVEDQSYKALARAMGEFINVANSETATQYLYEAQEDLTPIANRLVEQ